MLDLLGDRLARRLHRGRVNGRFDWAAPDEEVHAFVNELERPIGTYLYGRRMYETMVAWETIDDERPVMRDYAELWRAAEKVVYSRSLESVSSARTRIERDFDAGAVRQLKETARSRRQHRRPRARGPGDRGRARRRVPPDPRPGPGRRRQARVSRRPARDLELLDERRFAGGAVYLRYRLAMSLAARPA